MPIIHRIFRRQFAEVRALVQEVSAADATRVGAIADHLGFLLAACTCTTPPRTT